ncbi:class I SAM-dependent methyltransferase [Kistimonas scapharcae]|uniref:Class I SAM-dependent methyltransferase n=1 Tax=Kistimonas scapharcae TaxID=1036133 RepID=A0ABP8V9M4_9GAMM
MLTDDICPLCGSFDTRHYHRDKVRDYLHCNNCLLVFVPSSFHLSNEEEKAVYDQHDNRVDDAGYRRFLSRVFDPVVEHLAQQGLSQGEGLDFGCGPGPALAAMFSEAGHRMAVYDIYYAHKPEVLEQTYDFVTATEVIEHLACPGTVLKQLIGLLRPGGCLGVMTKRVQDRQAFARWHYIRDPTHICFYSEETFRWLASTYDFAMECCGNDVIILSRSD